MPGASAAPDPSAPQSARFIAGNLLFGKLRTVPVAFVIVVVDGEDIAFGEGMRVLGGGAELRFRSAFGIRRKACRIHAVVAATVPSGVVDADAVESVRFRRIENFVCGPVRGEAFLRLAFRSGCKITPGVRNRSGARGVDVVFPDHRADQFFNFRTPRDFLFEGDEPSFGFHDSAIPFRQPVVITARGHGGQPEFAAVVGNQRIEIKHGRERDFAGDNVDFRMHVHVAVVFEMNGKSGFLFRKNAEKGHVQASGGGHVEFLAPGFGEG